MEELEDRDLGQENNRTIWSAILDISEQKKKNLNQRKQDGYSITIT